LATGEKPFYYPCTPRGIIHLLDCYDIPIKGNRVCIIGRSNIVGRPLSWMMEQAGATVTLCHSLTPEKKLYEAIAESRIIVSAVGKPEFITRFRGNIVSNYNIDWGKKTFIDVGINRLDGHLCGDFHPSVYEVSHAYTPVPGGVGPMTVAMLMANVVEYYERIMHNEGAKREG
jgi:methylenetetrahydrofolate dehydrogenase (NADP+)/methenyltetrahydrofolate cyclohydrolase